MNDGRPTPPSRGKAVSPARVALALAAAAAVEIALEATTGSHRPRQLLGGRVLPAALWVAVVPVVMWMGARFPAHPGHRLRDLAAHALSFSAWFASTNLALRLIDAGGHRWTWVLDDTWSGMVRYLPTAALLWAVLAWAGRTGRPAAARERGPVTPPEEAPAASTDAPPTAPATGSADASPVPQALPLPGLNRIRLAPVASIRYLEADGDHVRVHAVDRMHRVRGRLSEFERKLAPTGAFVRIHRSHLVNLGHVREVQPLQHGDYVAVMGDGAELRIPRTRRRALARILGRTEPA